MNKYTFLVRSVRDALNAGESQRSLAKLAGVSHATISKLLSGKSGDVSLKTYRTLLDAAQGVVGRNAMQPQTLDATVEQLAARCIDSDLTHVRDTDLECAKYRRVMQLEAEVLAWKGQHMAAKVQIDEVKTELECGRIDVRKAEALTQVYSKDLQVMQASWKAACVQAEQLQKQLDHGQTAYNKIYAQYSQQVDDEREMLAQIDMLFAERDTAATKHEQQVMRLRVYVWVLVAALVFVVASGLVLWGAV